MEMSGLLVTLLTRPCLAIMMQLSACANYWSMNYPHNGLIASNLDGSVTYWGKTVILFNKQKKRRSNFWGISNRKLGFNDSEMLDKTRSFVSRVSPNGIFNCLWPILDQMSGTDPLPSYFSFNEVRHTNPRRKIRPRSLSLRSPSLKLTLKSPLLVLDCSCISCFDTSLGNGLC